MRMRWWALTLCVLVACALPGCAQISQASRLVFSTRVPAIGFLNGQLLQGEVLLSPDRTGVVTLASSSAALSSIASAQSGVAIVNCVGALRYTQTVSGGIDLRCSDGVQQELLFSMLTETRGYAYGQTAAIPMSLVYGMPAHEAQAYLRLPTDKKMVQHPNGLELR